MTPLALYFIAKTWLHFRGYMQVDLLLNLIFFTALLFPLPARLNKPWPKRLRLAAALLAVTLTL